jgi:hypothetical protein
VSCLNDDPFISYYMRAVELSYSNPKIRVLESRAQFLNPSQLFWDVTQVAHCLYLHCGSGCGDAFYNFKEAFHNVKVLPSFRRVVQGSRNQLMT